MAYLTNTQKHVEGTSISIDDSYKLKDLVLEGNTQQTGTPTPTTPIPVQVVSGDNKVKVEGTNLFSVKDWLDTLGATYTENSDGSITFQVQQNLYNTTYPIKPTDRCLWSFKAKNGTGGNFRFRYVYEDDYINETAGSGTGTSEVSISTSSSTGHGNVVGIRANWTTAGTFTIRESMLEQYVYGVSPRPYEPYIGNTYPINLGVENLIGLVNGTGTQNGITATTSNGEITLNGTATANSFVDIQLVQNYTLINGETYTISLNNEEANNNVSFRITGAGTYDTIANAVNKTNTITYDSSNAIFGNKITIRTSSGTTLTNFKLKPQIEKGSKANSYSEYGQAPIELCKIGNYQDRFIRNKGKNLFDNNLFDTFTPTIKVITLNLKPNTNYTLSSNIPSDYDGTIANLFIITSSGNPTTANNGVMPNSPRTMTTLNDGIIRIGYRDNSGNLSDEATKYWYMLNEGTSALPYEPYGNGDWYLKKEIGKVVLDGVNFKCNYVYNTPSSSFNVYDTANSKDVRGAKYNEWEGEGLILCDRLKGLSARQLNSNVGVTIYNQGEIRARLSTTETLTVAQVNEILQTNNYTIYYVLATPTYEKITNQELISQLEEVRLLEGVNNITVDSPYLSSILSLDYYSTENPYQDAIYSQDDSNDLKIYFNDVELEDAGRYCEKITRIARILPNDGGKRFSLDNFISTSVEVILHNVDIEDIVDQVRIEIGTDIGNNTFQYVPLGLFNIQDTPEKDGNKITLKLRDNRVKFDFNYNAYPLIQSLGGSATKKQILDDICEQAGVECLIDSFNGDSDLIGIYDSTISATTYVSYLMEQAGLIPVIDRYGRLIAIDLSQLDKWRIPLSIVESYEKGSPYGIERVVYESGTLKYETSDDDTLDTLYLNSANPYVSSNSQVSYILDKLQDFNIDSVTTKRVLGNPAIDPYDIIEVYNDLDGSNDIVFRTLGNTTYTFNGVHRDVFDTQIGKEERTENVTIRGLPAFQKYAKVEIDNMNATITQTVTSVEELQESIDLFSVDLSQYNVVIATDSDRKPYTTETVAVNYYGYYKGQQVTPTVAITGSESNVTVTTSNTAINFKVTQGNAVANKSYTYTATFTYNDAGTTYTVAKKIVLSLSIEGKAGQDGQDGQDGRDGTDGTSAYFYVRYSANADGSNMTVAPQSDTKYMGVASTTSSTPPTQPSGYVWSEIRGEDGQDGQQGIPGQPGADGTSSYLHIKWSDDGTSFTPAEGSTPAGKTPGRWQGTYVDTNQTDSTVFSDYNWVDTGIYVQDELNSLETSIGAVDARVTDTNTNIANNYYNKDQVDALSEANANNIATVTQRVVTLEQKSDSYAININKILTNGVSSVTTATGYVFNENGLNISKTGSEIANLLDNTGMFVRRNNTEMLGADSTGVRAENLLVRKYLIMGTNSRFEDYESNRTACFYIGGSN